MCGIFGILGCEDCFDYGINGLKQLQNRGYDSAGCCAIKDNKFILRKFATATDKDSIDKLNDYKEEFKECTSGIFHTRWATHGAKTDKNAHPHVDYLNRISLVHNGIIENYYDLKVELESNHNIKFLSETDSEVIVNLISVYYSESEHIEQAIMKAISRLRGTWALVIIAIDRPDNMYLARHGSPLLIGFGGSYIIVTSEQAGFNSTNCVNCVNNYVCLKNGDVTVLRRRDNKITFENMENYELKRVTVTSGELTPEPYQHWTIKEINEQYEASIRAISFGGRIIKSDEVKLGGLITHTEELKQVEHLILLGCGTSFNAGCYSMEYFKDLCNFTTVSAFDGSELMEADFPKKGKICCIFLSQSGETKDLYRCIKLCRNNNIFTLGVINVVDSLIAREVDAGCYLNAGREVGVASTKAFTSQIIILSMIAIFFAQIHGINQKKRQFYIDNLRQLPTDIKKTLSSIEDACKEIADHLVSEKVKDMFVLGKGSMIHTAEEGSLKVKEIGYIHSEAYGGNALRHGPYAIIEEGTPIIFLSPNDLNYSLMCNTIEEVKSRNASPIIVSDIDDDNVSRNCVYKLVVVKNDVYKGILHNLPMQLIAYYVAVLKGHNPDMPKNLSKCVSV